MNASGKLSKDICQSVASPVHGRDGSAIGHAPSPYGVGGLVGRYPPNLGVDQVRRKLNPIKSLGYKMPDAGERTGRFQPGRAGADAHQMSLSYEYLLPLMRSGDM